MDSAIARRFFEQVLRLACSQQLLGSEHFTVDSTLIESWASLKSLQKKGGPPPNDGGDGNMKILVITCRSVRFASPG